MGFFDFFRIPDINQKMDEYRNTEGAAESCTFLTAWESVGRKEVSPFQNRETVVKYLD